MSKWFWVILGVAVAVLIGLFMLSNNDSPSSSSANTEPEEITSEDHTEGKADSTVTLLEYGDFQCPACAAAYPNIKKLREEYGDRVRFVFRHFPLTNIHPNAFASSRAAEAAGKQGKFFEMHDILYERQKEWASSQKVQQLLRDYAKELGLNEDQFNDVVNANATNTRIDRDVDSGKSLGVDATPTFYLNGEKIEDTPRTYDQWKAKLDEALAKPTS